MAKLLVIAGTPYQVRDFLSKFELRKEDFKFVRNDQDLRGYDINTPIILTGTCWENPAYQCDRFLQFKNVRHIKIIGRW